MSLESELNTMSSTMSDLSRRITALVEGEGDHLPAEVYTELVAVERTVGTLLRRLQRVADRVKDPR